MRIVYEKWWRLWGQYLISCHTWKWVVFHSSADFRFLTLVKVSPLLGESRHIWPPLAAVHVWQGHMLSLHAEQPAPLPDADTRPNACWSYITAGNYLPKTRTVLDNDSHQSTIFSAMKRNCCCQHCFLRERMTRQREWNRAMLYKEDYEDKTTLTSLKFEDTSTEIWRLSKSSCLLEGWQLAVRRALVNVKKATQKKKKKKKTSGFYLWS